MIRLAFFLVGLAAFLCGAQCNLVAVRDRITLPFDPCMIEVGFSMARMTLDVVLMVAGVFLIMIAWIFKKLNQ